jgi:type II secretory pathway pseudopilin PulG
LIGIVAAASIPVLRSQSPAKLDAATTEVGNVLRFAISEANRTGAYLFVDGSSDGRLRVFNATSAGLILGNASDPLTKAALVIDASAPPWSGDITMRASFLQGGNAYKQLLVGPGTQLVVFDSGLSRGVMQSGSGVTLTLGASSATVTLDTTGKVTLP